MNENKESIAAKWDSIDTGRELEKNDVKQFNANVAAKVELLQQLRADGKLKKDYSDDKIENWSISASLPGTKIAGLLKPEANEMFNRQGPRKVNLDSIADVDRSGWTPDGGGGSIGYAEWEDGTEMTPLEIQDYFEANHELYDDIMQGIAEGSCGYGIDGVPGDTPGETKGARADDRTNGMVKMLRKTQEPRELREKIKKIIQKEISKLNETK
jgi:hypothetical protein